MPKPVFKEGLKAQVRRCHWDVVLGVFDELAEFPICCRSSGRIPVHPPGSAARGRHPCSGNPATVGALIYGAFARLVLTFHHTPCSKFFAAKERTEETGIRLSRPILIDSSSPV